MGGFVFAPTSVCWFSVEWPRLDAALAAATAGWLLILLVAVAALGLLRAFRDAIL